MRDKGIDKGLVQEFNTSDKRKGNKYGFRKMFWDYLNKLNVQFYDTCCVTANGNTEDSSILNFPVRYNSTETVFERFDGTNWIQAQAGVFNTTEIGVDSLTSNEDPTISVDTPLVEKRTASAINATATATAAQLSKALITSTSAAAVALTLPTATDFANYVGATRGTTFDFLVDNSAGANTVTVTVNTGITAVTAVITGGATLTVAAGAVGIFKLIYTSATVAKIARIV